MFVVPYFTYTPPSSIEGEPDEVAAIATQQVRRLAAVVADVTKETYVQLRNAGINPDDEDAVEAWLATEAGACARDLFDSARHFAEAAKAL